MKQRATVFVVHMVHSLASKVFRMANEIGIMSEGYAWILTESTTTSLNSMNNNFSTLSWMQGVLGVKTYIPRTMEVDNFTIRWRRKFLLDNPEMIIKYYPKPDVFGLWAYDATRALAMAVERSFNISSGASQNGKKIMESLSMIKFKGLSGRGFSLGKLDQLESQNLQIVNVIGDGEISTVGYWKPEMGLTGEFNKKVKLRPIIWPGYSFQPPKGRIPFNPRKILRIGVPFNLSFTPFFIRNDHGINGYCIDIFQAAVAELDPYYSFPYEFIPFHGSSYDDLIVAVYRGVGAENISGLNLIFFNGLMYSLKYKLIWRCLWPGI